jgi:hypothetical protein
MPKEKKSVLKIKAGATPATRPKKLEEGKALVEKETKKEEKMLTREQELFCQYYVTQEFFANGVKSYMEAFQVEPTPKGYESAKHGAYRLLQEVHICTRINNLLELSGLNDSFVDKQMEFMITQNADFWAKLTAMKMYNDLKNRVTKNIKHQGDKDNPLELKATITAVNFLDS